MTASLLEGRTCWGGQGAVMVPLIILGVATVVMLVVVAFGATRIFRQRRFHMADLPELPSPGDKPPTMQA